MAGGRPTKYNNDILAKANDYLDSYNTEYGDMIPSIEGLAEVLDIARTTIYDWESQEDKKEFSYILEKLMAKQKKVLMNNGLSGDFNSNITKLVLTKHGLSDKAEIAHKGDFIVNLSDKDSQA